MGVAVAFLVGVAVAIFVGALVGCLVAEELALGVWVDVADGVGERVGVAESVALSVGRGEGEGAKADCEPQAANTDAQRRRTGASSKRFPFFINGHPFHRQNSTKGTKKAPDGALDKNEPAKVYGAYIDFSSCRKMTKQK